MLRFPQLTRPVGSALLRIFSLMNLFLLHFLSTHRFPLFVGIRHPTCFCWHCPVRLVALPATPPPRVRPRTPSFAPPVPSPRRLFFFGSVISQRSCLSGCRTPCPLTPDWHPCIAIVMEAPTRLSFLWACFLSDPWLQALRTAIKCWQRSEFFEERCTLLAVLNTTLMRAPHRTLSHC